MSFNTDWIKLKPQVLETIISNLPKPAEKFRLTIKFPSQQKYREFLRLEEQRKESQENQAEIKSQSDDQQQKQKIMQNSKDSQIENKMNQSNDSSVKSVPKNQEVKKQLENNYINLEFENAIIYKQFYQQRFDQIGKKNKVKISILPKKIKLVGEEVEDIQNAMDDAQLLIDSVVIRLISKYGSEAHQSQFIKKQLKSKNIQILKVLNKFYLWYELKGNLDKESRTKIEIQIDRMRDAIFQNSCHKFYSLLRGGQFQPNLDKQSTVKNEPNGQNHKLYLLDEDINFFQSKSQKWYVKLIQLCKAQMFKNQARNKLNQHYDDNRQIQLTSTNNQLIIHCDKEEQLSLREEQIKHYYKQFDTFFITFDQSANQDQILQVLGEYQYSQKKRQPNFDASSSPYIHSLSNLELLKKQDKQLKDYLIVCVSFNLIKQNNKQMLQEMLNKLFKLNQNIKISFQLGNDQQLQSDQNPKLQFQFQAEQRVIHITPKNRNWANFQTILNDYIIDHKLLQSNKNPTDMTIQASSVSMNVTNPIQDSTFMNDKTEDQISQSNILDSLAQIENIGAGMKKKQNNNAQNLNEHQQIIKLNSYNFFIPQTEQQYNAKFDETVLPDKIVNSVKIPMKKKRELEEHMKQFSSIPYKKFAVKVNPLTKNFKFYDKTEQKNEEIITMFAVSPKRIGKSEIEQCFTVHPLSDSKELKKDGYLVNVRRKDVLPSLRRTGKTQYTCFFQVKNASPYEVVRYLEHLTL